MLTLCYNHTFRSCNPWCCKSCTLKFGLQKHFQSAIGYMILIILYTIIWHSQSHYYEKRGKWALMCHSDLLEKIQTRELHYRGLFLNEFALTKSSANDCKFINCLGTCFMAQCMFACDSRAWLMHVDIIVQSNAIHASQWHCHHLSDFHNWWKINNQQTHQKQSELWDVCTHAQSIAIISSSIQSHRNKYANSRIIPEVRRGLTYIIVLLITHS